MNMSNVKPAQSRKELINALAKQIKEFEGKKPSPEYIESIIKSYTRSKKAITSSAYVYTFYDDPAEYSKESIFQPKSYEDQVQDLVKLRDALVATKDNFVISNNVVFAKSFEEVAMLNHVRFMDSVSCGFDADDADILIKSELEDHNTYIVMKLSTKEIKAIRVKTKFTTKEVTKLK